MNTITVPADVLEDIYSLAACDNHCGSNDCPFCSIGNEIRELLAVATAEAKARP